MITGYETFGVYQALKLHFTQESYDYFKYNGKSNISVTSFENRKDKYHFYKLSRKYTDRDTLVNFLVSNFLEDDKMWVGSTLQEEAEVNYRKRQKVIQSLSYVFENDCLKLFEHENNPNSILKVTNGEHPILLKSTMRKEIEIETACILNMILDFLPRWQTKITDTIIWPLWCSKIKKYAAFLPQDVIKYKFILKKVIT